MSTKFCNFKMANMINQKNKKNVCFKVLMLPACGAKLEQTQKLLNKEHTLAVSNSCLTMSTCSSIYLQVLNIKWGFPGDSDGKESACSEGDLVRSLGQEDPWRRKWQPTPVFFPGEFHGQRSLVGYSPWGHKELDMTE